MRITISSDDKGKVHIDTGEAGQLKSDTTPDVKPGLFESTTGVPVIDAGPAPVQEIERTQGVIASAEAGRSLSATAPAASPEEREAQLPLNPLRAGAAAAYRDPANLRKRAADTEGTFAVAQQQPQQQPSATTFDGGAAQVSESKEASATPTSEQRTLNQEASKRPPSSKRAKNDKRR
jgi:hypothetical protein